jgi:multidrug efflux pump subunit AcrB
MTSSDRQPRRDLLGIFAHHKVAANLLMLMMLLAGAFALERLNIQFFPNFALDIVTVRVVWTGASAEDVETGITDPLEQRLKNVDNLRKMTSTSALGVSSITLEFEEGTDTVIALDQVKQQVDEFRNLPQDAEEPEVTHAVNYEQVARLLITGPDTPAELRALAHSFETELLRRGIDRITFNGRPEEQISIEVGTAMLHELGMTLGDIAERIGDLSRDVPAGTVGDGEAARELRSLDQRRDPSGFARLPVISEDDYRVDLGAIAHIERQPRRGGVTLSEAGRPAVELLLQRAESGDSLEAAKVIEQWLEDTRPTLPPGIELRVYDESWQLIKQRIMLLLKNGLGGLVLVVGILYLFLTARVAFWVAVGIPISFMATLAILYVAGDSINMISLFALIMALGIIVDDAIVVGEDALAHYQAGEEPLLAAEGGARRMLAPVMASSLTTVAAFLPLMLVGGIIGKILFTIPLVIIAVILASVVESFLVLPGHLRHSFVKLHHAPATGLRARLDGRFEQFREHTFRPFVTAALNNRAATVATALSVMLFAVGLLAGRHLNFTFFPSPESRVIYANVAFVAGTPREKVDRFLAHLEQTLRETEAALGGALVEGLSALHGRQGEELAPVHGEWREGDAAGRLLSTVVGRHGSSLSAQPHLERSGDQLGALMVELVPSEQRSVRNSQFIHAWQERVVRPAGLEHFTISARQAGPPGRDVNVRLSGHDALTLKQAALDLASSLETIPGMYGVEDDMPYGREQLVYELTAAGEALELTTAELGRQLRTAFEGRLVQIFQDGPDEIEVRVQLPESERDLLGTLGRVNVRVASGASVPLASVASWRPQQGFQAVRHAEGQLAVEVSGEVDTGVTNANRVLASLEQSVLPELQARYGVNYSFEGRAADQAETIGDMKHGLWLGLTLIYLVLAWVFSSYGWPLVVMAVIPFGVVGALIGHWLMGLDITILSLFGLFGLSGIVVNDSIILVSFYQRLRGNGMGLNEALVESSCQRLRAVLLTSLTTIAGLTPLLFETSLQAQFLIPMATSIAFGLAFATVLVLVLVPVLLSLHEQVHQWLRQRLRGGFAGAPDAAGD